MRPHAHLHSQGWQDRIGEYLEKDTCLHAVGQGSIGQYITHYNTNSLLFQKDAQNLALRCGLHPNTHHPQVLGLESRPKKFTPFSFMVDFSGLECREDDSATRSLLEQLTDFDSAVRCYAERAFMKALEGGPLPMLPKKNVLLSSSCTKATSHYT